MVFNTDGLLYPDSVVGTDSHTTMINGLGVVGWGKLAEHVHVLGHVGLSQYCVSSIIRCGRN